MEPGAKRHARVEAEHDIAWRREMLAPGRPDHCPPADAHDREVLLPRLCPVLLVDDARL
jgi:hypothetical protein